MPGVCSVVWNESSRAGLFDALLAYDEIKIDADTAGKIAEHIGGGCTTRAVQRYIASSKSKFKPKPGNAVPVPARASGSRSAQPTSMSTKSLKRSKKQANCDEESVEDFYQSTFKKIKVEEPIHCDEHESIEEYGACAAQTGNLDSSSLQTPVTPLRSTHQNCATPSSGRLRRSSSRNTHHIDDCRVASSFVGMNNSDQEMIGGTEKVSDEDSYREDSQYKMLDDDME